MMDLDLFTVKQRTVLEDYQARGFDVSPVARREWTASLIRLGCSLIASGRWPKVARLVDSGQYDAWQLWSVFRAALKDLDLSIFNPGFNADQMNILYRGLRDALPVDVYADTRITSRLMWQAYKRLSSLGLPDAWTLPVGVRACLRDWLSRGVYCSDAFKPGLSVSDVEEMCESVYYGDAA